jgi:hypothetical protein
MERIFTLRDAREERLLAELNREHRRAVKEAKAKVRRWRAKVRQFGGDIHRETLARMEANLAKLEA